MTNDQIQEIKMALSRGEVVKFIFSPGVEWRVKPKTININGYEVPEPLRTVSKGRYVFYVSIETIPSAIGIQVKDEQQWEEWLRLGIVHATREAAELHAKALLSFTDGSKP